MCVKKNPPFLWLTIHLADTQDPITPVLCGEEINLDHFSLINNCPNVAAVTGDLFASAAFFHLIINAVLKHLLGIKGFSHNQTSTREKGIFGLVYGFIGTVEAQGQGTLHLHMILWL